MFTNIDDIIIESEMNVINALMNSYDKALTILENYDGDDLSSFNIFQEEYIMESKKDNDTTTANTATVANDTKTKKQNIFVRMFNALKKLMQTFISFIKNKFSRKNIDEINEITKEISNMDNKKKKIFNKYMACVLGAGGALITGGTAVYSIKNKKSNNTDDLAQSSSVTVVKDDEAREELKKSLDFPKDNSDVKKKTDDTDNDHKSQNTNDIDRKIDPVVDYVNSQYDKFRNYIRNADDLINKNKSSDLWKHYGLTTEPIGVKSMYIINSDNHVVILPVGPAYVKHFFSAFDIIVNDITGDSSNNSKNIQNLKNNMKNNPLRLGFSKFNEIFSFINETDRMIKSTEMRYNKFIVDDNIMEVIDARLKELSINANPQQIVKFIESINMIAVNVGKALLTEYNVVEKILKDCYQVIYETTTSQVHTNSNSEKDPLPKKEKDLSEYKPRQIIVDAQSWYQKVIDEVDKIKNVLPNRNYKYFMDKMKKISTDYDGDTEDRFIATHEAINKHIYSTFTQISNSKFQKLDKCIKTIGYEPVIVKPGDPAKKFAIFFENMIPAHDYSDASQIGKIKTINVQPYQISIKIGDEECYDKLCGKCSVYKIK